jgi:hypothetical protein
MELEIASLVPNENLFSFVNSLAIIAKAEQK